MGTGKKILIAVDGSAHSLQAIKYVATLCSGSPVEVSLLHVLPLTSEELLWQISMDENFKSKIKEQFERFNDECQRAAQKFLDEAKEIMVSSGYVPDFIMTMLRQWQTGIARDIIAEAQKGYNAVVVGRRGIGKVESLMLGSVCTKVVHGVDQIPVWVIGGEILFSKMLLAVDASLNSRQAVIYAAPYAAQIEAEVTLLHVVRKFFPGWSPYLTSAGEKIEAELHETLKARIQEMFEEYKGCLENAGVAPDKIRTECEFGSYSRAAEILATAREGNYGTVIMGRRGISAVRQFIMGRVTTKVLNGAEGLAVWIVPGTPGSPQTHCHSGDKP
jgi:nucleotide-binding universal stress UspA family protein